jgi:hypothetical protein
VGGATFPCAILHHVIQPILVKHVHNQTLLLHPFLPCAVENDPSVCHSILKKLKYNKKLIKQNGQETQTNKQTNKQSSTLFNSNTGCFIMNVPNLKPYISATTNPK